jgi:seryl-tRNA synthetase
MENARNQGKAAARLKKRAHRPSRELPIPRETKRKVPLSDEVSQLLKTLRSLDDIRLNRDVLSDERETDGRIDSLILKQIIKSVKNSPLQIEPTVKSIRELEALHQRSQEIIACQEPEAAALELEIIQNLLSLWTPRKFQPVQNPWKIASDIAADIRRLQKIDAKMYHTIEDEQAWLEDQLGQIEMAQFLEEEEQVWLNEQIDLIDDELFFCGDTNY